MQTINLKTTSMFIASIVACIIFNHKLCENVSKDKKSLSRLDYLQHLLNFGVAVNAQPDHFLSEEDIKLANYTVSPLCEDTTLEDRKIVVIGVAGGSGSGICIKKIL